MPLIYIMFGVLLLKYIIYIILYYITILLYYIYYITIFGLNYVRKLILIPLGENVTYLHNVWSSPAQILVAIGYF
jgi:hypothetical protein